MKQKLDTISKPEKGIPERHITNKFEVPMAVTMNNTTLWNMMPCKLVEVDQHFERYCHMYE
jgi:hypothetical protein